MAMLLRDRLSDKEYINWLKVSVGLGMVTDAAEKLAKSEMERWHAELLETLGPERCPFVDNNKKCECNVCAGWRDHVKKMHINAGGIYWKNSDRQRWQSDLWQIAKLFMNSGQEKVGGPEETDVSGLLNLIKNCKRFDDLVSRKLTEKIIEIRNCQYHKRNFKMSEDVLKQRFNNMTEFVKDIRKTGKNPNADPVVQALKQLENEQNFTEQHAKYHDVILKTVTEHGRRLEELEAGKDKDEKITWLHKNVTCMKDEWATSKDEWASSKDDIANLEKVVEQLRQNVENREDGFVEMISQRDEKPTVVMREASSDIVVTSKVVVTLVDGQGASQRCGASQRTTIGSGWTQQTTAVATASRGWFELAPTARITGLFLLVAISLSTLYHQYSLRDPSKDAVKTLERELTSKNVSSDAPSYKTDVVDGRWRCTLVMPVSAESERKMTKKAASQNACYKALRLLNMPAQETDNCIGMLKEYLDKHYWGAANIEVTSNFVAIVHFRLIFDGSSSVDEQESCQVAAAAANKELRLGRLGDGGDLRRGASLLTDKAVTMQQDGRRTNAVGMMGAAPTADPGVSACFRYGFGAQFTSTAAPYQTCSVVEEERASKDYLHYGKILQQKFGSSSDIRYEPLDGSSSDVRIFISIRGEPHRAKKTAHQDACRRVLEMLGQPAGAANQRNQLQEFFQKRDQPLPSLDDVPASSGDGFVAIVTLQLVVHGVGADAWLATAARKALDVLGLHGDDDLLNYIR